jgi:type II secretory pathway component PulC
VIVGVNRRRITSADDMRAVIESLRSRQVVRVFLERDGAIVYTDLEFQ